MLFRSRDIPVSEGVHFYCYIIADKTNALEKQAYKAELEKTPDNQGFFGYKKHYRAYIEFISYSKLYTEAKQRNRAFFDKLGVPTTGPLRAERPGVLGREIEFATETFDGASIDGNGSKTKR